MMSTDTELREQVRQRYAAAATAVTEGDSNPDASPAKRSAASSGR